MSNNSASKAAVLIGLSIVMGGAWDANAATTCTVDRSMLTNPVGEAAALIGFVKSDGCEADTKLPMTESERVSSSTLPDDSVSDPLSSAQINPLVGALTHTLAFSVNSAISSALPLGDGVGVEGAPKSDSRGPFDFSNVAGLQSGLTDLTGSGKAVADAVLTDLTSLSVASNGKKTGQGLTLDPAATPLPASLALFLTGIGGLGLLGWGRRRRSRVSLLGAG